VTAAETIAHGVKIFSQEVADLRHSLHIRQAQVAEKDKRIAELEAALRPFAIPGPAGVRLFRPDGSMYEYAELEIETADVVRARKVLGIIE